MPENECQKMSLPLKHGIHAMIDADIMPDPRMRGDSRFPVEHRLSTQAGYPHVRTTALQDSIGLQRAPDPQLHGIHPFATDSS
ncbi:MAG: hypothetical protein AB8B64_18090 [Granulosicoccus sp.]